MAKGKKKENLTLEEKLERALVPREEWPYEVPGNWCWVRLGSVSKVVTGGTPSKKHEEYYGDECPFFKPADLDAGRSVFVASEYLSQEGKRQARIIPAQSTLVCCIGTIGKSGFLEVEGCTNQQINAVIPKINPLYMYYFINSETFVNELWEKSSATTISIINKRKMEDNKVALPPLKEQQRIVEQIERLFFRLDEAKEKARETLDGFEERKAAILHKAFSGELTEKLIKENKVSKEWEVTTIKKCCKIGSGGTPSRKCSEYYNGNIPWIKTGEINWNEIYNAEECISEMGVENSSAKIYEEGAILVAMYGMGVTRGRAAILKTKAATNQAVCVLLPCENVLNYYLFYYFMCNYWDIRKQAIGGNQLNLSATIIGAFEIEIPSMEEQKEIVRLLDVLLEKENQNKGNVEMVLDYIEMMKKSILTKAFRGELGTNDLEEESSIEFLKQLQ